MEWKQMSFYDEYEFVKKQYVPFILQCRGQHQTLVDLGHHNLFFAKALIEYLLSETKFRFIFVRIRRERYELAVSLIFGTPGTALTNMCKDTGWRLCPFERREDVIIPVPNERVWAKLTNFQQALWMIDEVEARWLSFIAAFPQMERLEVFWEKAGGPASFDAAAMAVGDLFGVQSAPYHWLHKKVHAGKLFKNLSYSIDFKKEDSAYRAAIDQRKRVWNDALFFLLSGCLLILLRWMEWKEERKRRINR